MTVTIRYIGKLPMVWAQDTVLVENDTDYVQACSRFLPEGSPSFPQDIWVRSQTHVRWLEDFVGQIGLTVATRPMTAQDVLADQWNVSIPDWLTDDMVLSNGLLDLSLENQQPASFIDRILGHFFGDALSAGRLSAENLASVIKALIGERVQNVLEEYPILRQCLEDKCSQWKENSPESWIHAVCEAIPPARNQVWKWVTFRILLGSYPRKLMEYVLPPHQIQIVDALPVKGVDALPLEPSAQEEAVQQIELFFESLQAEIIDSQSFQKILGFTSGRLLREFTWIERLIKASDFSVTRQDVEQVQRRFESCPGVSTFQLTSLNKYVKPSRPKILKEYEAWSREEWIRWTVEEYMPYRTWQINNQYFDKEVEETVQQFSHWYLDAYESIHQASDVSMVHFLGKAVLDHGEPSAIIILLVDGLPLNFFELLDTALINLGFSRHALEHRFVPLPTSTMYTKPQIISGSWDIPHQDYAKILKQRAEGEWLHWEPIYVSNLKSLAAAKLSSKNPILLFNFTDCDELLHEDMEAKHMTHEEQLQYTFNRMEEVLNTLLETWKGAREQVTVLTLTDHGASRILDEERTAFESSVISRIFPDEKYRYGRIEGAEADEVPKNLWDLGFSFKRPFAKDEPVFFIPKGHNTVKGLRKLRNGYAHGGATPEEVIVPAAKYRLIKVPWKAPSARFLNLSIDPNSGKAKFYIQRLIPVELEIQNPNPQAITIHNAGIISPDADIKGSELPEIPSSGVGVLRMDCYFKKGALEADELVMEFDYKVAGEKRTKTISLSSEFRSAMSTGFNLRDL